MISFLRSRRQCGTIWNRFPIWIVWLAEFSSLLDAAPFQRRRHFPYVRRSLRDSPSRFTSRKYFRFRDIGRKIEKDRKAISSAPKV